MVTGPSAPSRRMSHMAARLCLFAALLMVSFPPCSLAGDSLPPLAVGQRLAYAGYLSGAGRDTVQAMARDKDGGIWVAGSSSSWREFTAPNWPFQANLQGGRDAFVAKYRIRPDGSADLLFWTWIGGSGDEDVSAMAVDDVGRVYIVGTTTSSDFPRAGNSFQWELGGSQDAFIAIIDPRFQERDSMYYTSLIGGSGAEVATALAVEPDGKVLIAGYTNSIEYDKFQNGLQPVNRGAWNAFLVRIDPFLQDSLLYGTYFGGTATDFASGVGVDSKGYVWMTGYTTSADTFPVTDGAYQTTAASNADVFLAKFDLRQPGLDALVYCTFLGGSALDVAQKMVIDAQGFIWIGGYTLSFDFPTTPDAYQTAYGGFGDAFLMKIDPSKLNANPIAYSTYLGGADGDVLYSFQVGADGRVVMAGYTMSPDFPVTAETLQNRLASDFADAFLTVLDPQKPGKAALEYSTYYGGNYTDVATDVLIDAAGYVLLCGYTTSTDLPATDGSVKGNPPAVTSGFLAAIGK